MTPTLVRKVILVFTLLTVIPAWGAEPLAGVWRLKTQNVGGQKSDPDPLTLRIIAAGSGFEFAYSVPINDVQFVAMRFTCQLDGTEADVKDAKGNKIGSAKINKAGASQYTVVLRGANRPTASSKVTVSADGKTLSFETDSNAAPGGGPLRTTQVFERQ